MFGLYNTMESARNKRRKKQRNMVEATNAFFNQSISFARKLLNAGATDIQIRNLLMRDQKLTHVQAMEILSEINR